MNVGLLLYFFGLTVVGFCQKSETEVNEYVEAIKTLEDEVFNYKFPTDSSSYLQGHDEFTGYADAGTFDFIIVGAGSTGSVLANRISEHPQFKILLLEAGIWENKLTDIPELMHFLKATPYNWGFQVTPQTNKFKGYLNQSLHAPSGKAFGGGSVINDMIYVRGNKDDFDKWAQMGNPGWSYNEVFPYFLMSENVSFSGSEDGYHGHNGTLHVETSRIFDEVGQAFLDAQLELGRDILDYNGAKQMGFSIAQVNIVNGRRDSGSKAFLAPAKDRKNLKISPESLVLKILIDESNTARGVKFIRNGTIYFAKATKEVILSAGAIQTPHLLMLSGIGPRHHLEEMKIPVIKDLKVGDNLWDHVAYISQSYSVNYTYENTNLSTQVRQYLQGKGPLTSGLSLQCLGFVSLLTGRKNVPDVEQVFFTPLPTSQPYAYYKNLNRNTEDTMKYVYKPQENIPHWLVYSVLLHPMSRGTIRLKSNSPFDFPLIDPGYFNHPFDLETLVLALRDVQQMANTIAMQKYNSTIIKVIHPVCKQFQYDSDDFWGCMVENLADTISHYAGTCKMGPESDPTTVVDHYMRVHGVKQLKIADCSIIPVTTSGHLNAVAYMIGEKAADIIKEYYKVK